MLVRLYKCVFLFTLTVALSAQDSSPSVPESTEPLATVQNIRTAVNNALILLSWTHTPASISSSHQIFRAMTPITVQTISRAKNIGEIAPGHTLFTDVTNQTGNYYYAIIPTKTLETQNDYSVRILPYQNASEVPTVITETNTTVARAAVVRYIRAIQEDNIIHLNFIPSKTGRRLQIYRSQKAIQTADDLKDATVIATIDSSRRSFSDEPPPANKYYYGIYDEVLARLEMYFIVQKENTLMTPVSNIEIFSHQDTGYVDDLMLQRHLILPELHSSNEFTSLLVPDSQVTLGAAAEEIIASFNTSVRTTPQKAIPNIPIQDQAMEVAINLFRIGNYAEAVRHLEDIDLDTLHEREGVLVHFYLGQNYYWLGRYIDALLEMISVQDFDSEQLEGELDLKEIIQINNSDSLYVFSEQYIQAILSQPDIELYLNKVYDQ